ncbi:MAG TPA: NAD(P)-dependent oxidoreductase [Caldimonas sp.]|nr:NAD(P)-dependent oxidoreductase [Caldimonas sp.]
MMRILVTGGAGNIGRDVTRLLRELGHEPVVYDLVAVDDDSGRCIQGDIRDPSSLERAFDEVRPHGVIHLAGTLQFACEADPTGTVSVNVDGTAAVLDAALRAGASRFVLSSSAAVYGSTAETVVETSPVQGDISVYGASKLLAERMLHRYAVLHGMTCRTVRLSTVVSARRVASPGVAAAVRSILDSATGADVAVSGIAGHELRHFVHVSDAAQGAILALVAGDDVKGELFNIAGSDDAYLDFDALVALVRRVRPHAGRVSFAGASGHRGRIDCTRAKRELGYRPRYTMQRAIQEAIETCPVNTQ